MMKKAQSVFVAGASGVVGSMVLDELLKQGYCIHALTNSLPAFSLALHRLDDNFGKDVVNRYVKWYTRVELRSCQDMESLKQELAINGAPSLDAALFCFGLWPQHGLFEELGKPFTHESEEYWALIETYYIQSIMHMFGSLCDVMHQGGKAIFITSSFADLSNKECPPWLIARQYKNCKLRLDSIVKALKNSPELHEKGIRIQRIGITAQKKVYLERVPDSDTESGIKLLRNLREHIKDALTADKMIDMDIVYHQDGGIAEINK